MPIAGGLREELRQPALEVAEQQVDVEHVVRLDRLRLGPSGLAAAGPGAQQVRVLGQLSVHRQLLGGGRLQAAALHGEDHHELHAAGGAGDLDRVAVLDLTEHPQLAVPEAAAADRAVVVASAVPDEVDEPHLAAMLRPRPSMQTHPSGPTTAPWSVPAGRAIRSPGQSRMSRSLSVNVIEPATQ